MSNVFSCTATVVRDAEVRYLQSGAAVLNVTVANNIGYGDKQDTLFIRVALFGKRAEGKLKEFLLKGQQVFISGELTQSEYKANDGTTKKSLELIANIVDLVGGKREGQQPNAQPAQSQQPRPQAASAENNAAPYDDFDDSIPF